MANGEWEEGGKRCSASGCRCSQLVACSFWSVGSDAFRQCLGSHPWVRFAIRGLTSSGVAVEADYARRPAAAASAALAEAASGAPSPSRRREEAHGWQCGPADGGEDRLKAGLHASPEGRVRRGPGAGEERNVECRTLNVEWEEGRGGARWAVVGARRTGLAAHGLKLVACNL